MKILQINNYHYLMGGSERVYFETSKLLEKNGHQVLFFSVKDEKSEDHYSDKYFVKPFDYKNASSLKKIKHASEFIYNKEAKENLELLLQNEKPDIQDGSDGSGTGGEGDGSEDGEDKNECTI